MKKTYKNPTIKVVKMQPRNLLAGSAYGAGLMGKKASKNYETLGREAEFSDWDEE